MGLRLAASWLFALFLFFANTTYAQSVDFEDWAQASSTIAQELESETLPDEAFQALRASLTNWRDRFLSLREVNAVEIDALTAQLAALGDPPAEGESESEAVAVRRVELTDALELARAPRREAEEALARANALISQIDATLRERQADAFLEYQGTPLDPTRWPSALAQLAALVESIRAEVSTTLQSSRSLSDRLPVSIAFVLLAIALVWSGPQRIERLIAQVERNAGEHGRLVYGFIVSLGAVFAPLIAVTLLNAALINTGILGEVGQAAAVGINAGILAYAVSRWLGNRIFSERDFIPSPLTLDHGERALGRVLSRWLGLILASLYFLQFIRQGGALEPIATGVATVPIFAALGIVLFRLGKLIRAGTREQFGEEPVAGFTDYVRRILGRAVQFVGVAGPLAAIVGYFNMAEGILMPTAESLALLALLATLHYLIRAGYAMIRGLAEDEATAALAPVLITFILSLAASPLFALAWGARTTDISEVWTRIRTGIDIGGTTISPTDFLTFALVFGLIYLITRLIQGTLRSSVLPRTRIDKGGQNAIISGLGYLGLLIAVVSGINAAGIDLSSLALVVGALSVGIGFGLQNIVNNFVSGIILLIERPVAEGDWVEVNGHMGYVRSISVRSTRIETFDRSDVIVPNGDFISGTVTNWTRGNSIGRVIVPVGVAYGTDPRRVETILKEIAEDHPLVTISPPPGIVFTGFGADSMDFEIRAILKDVNYMLSVKSDMNFEIVRRFSEEGIEIPFAQRDVWLRNPEALTQSAPGEKREPTDPLDVTLNMPEDGDTD